MGVASSEAQVSPQSSHSGTFFEVLYNLPAAATRRPRRSFGCDRCAVTLCRADGFGPASNPAACLQPAAAIDTQPIYQAELLDPARRRGRGGEGLATAARLAHAQKHLRSILGGCGCALSFSSCSSPPQRSPSPPCFSSFSLISRMNTPLASWPLSSLLPPRTFLSLSLRRFRSEPKRQEWRRNYGVDVPASLSAQLLLLSAATQRSIRQQMNAAAGCC